MNLEKFCFASSCVVVVVVVMCNPNTVKCKMNIKVAICVSVYTLIKAKLTIIKVNFFQWAIFVGVWEGGGA